MFMWVNRYRHQIARRIWNPIILKLVRPFSQLRFRMVMFGSGGLSTLFARFFWPTTIEVEAESPQKFIYAAKGDLKSLQQDCSRKTGGDPKIVRNYVNERHEHGWTMLMSAACNGQLEVVKWLIQNGADINQGDQYIALDRKAQLARAEEFPSFNETYPAQGWTPLHYATGFGQHEVVFFLLSQGADRNAEARIMGKACKPDQLPQVDERMRFIYEAHDARMTKDKDLIEKQRKQKERVANPLEDRLSGYMVGQYMPIYTVSSALRRKQNGWHDEDKPLVFLFLGSSGVGKTMLAKSVAELLPEAGHEAFIRVDMSEFQHKHEVSKFIGAPPGYVGFEQGGQLTEKLKQHPCAVVLLDEVEKAHPDVLNVLLQVFDEGRLTDGRGKTVDCRNATFIMTSNLVQNQIGTGPWKIRPSKKWERTETGELTRESAAELAQVRAQTTEFLKVIAQPILKKHFKRDEFLGRINEIVVFHPFDKKDLEEIVLKELNRWKGIALKRHNITLQWDQALVNSLTLDFNESYGFRSIKHEVEKRVINVVAAAYERDTLRDGSSVLLSLSGDKHSVDLRPGQLEQA